MHDRRASPTFLLTHRFHALSDSLIRSGWEGCLEFLKEFHALDVVVVAELCHHVFSSSPPVLEQLMLPSIKLVDDHVISKAN